ncbi:hypothetical protein SAMD00019534_021480 [Acytostelium subglobosum LB1]|uniref:hypothetical protein n=1 Tax=Acytostelium subglobosum LB1 TaxID=1410327 RepID=UPI000644BE0B|nr:hypothetical protein SAMD00019534_021480 [Acytostelium subglobosum LB1]GAM18973.1 hypothetical protein SAMD00019534_021480 [Acytostelium subglobosum LB1]|eukprot:XP_012758193.1 hypothetical protein SAMD00019534_021480 [Acytostelium subglobosum LB1]
MDYVESEVLLSSNSRSDVSKYDYQVVGRKTPRRFWFGLVIILLTNISLSIVSLTIWPYLSLNVESIYILAISISVFHGGASLGKKLFTMVGERYENYWTQLILALSIAMMGDILYAAFPQQFLIIVARFIVGIGSGSSVILQSMLVPKGSDHTTQVNRLTWMSLTTSLAYVAGPALVAAVSLLNINDTVNLYHDSGTVAFFGWLASFFTFIALVLASVGKVIDKSQHKSIDNDIFGSINDIQPIGTGYRSQQSCIFPPKVTLTIMCFIHYLIFNCGTILETVLIPDLINVGGYSTYNWNLTKVAMLFVGLGVSCGVAAYLSKRIQSNNLLLYISMILFTLGYAFMCSWKFQQQQTTGSQSPSAPDIVRFLLGVIMVAIAYPTAIASSITLFFELISTVYIKKASNMFLFASNFGRLLGPLWAVLIFERIGDNAVYVYGVCAGLVSLILLLSIGRSFKFISTNSNIQRNVPILNVDDEDDGVFR